jgi:hypothetical protein
MIKLDPLEQLLLEVDRMPFFPGSKWDCVRDMNEETLHELMPLIDNLQNPEVKNKVLQWFEGEARSVSRGYYSIHWDGLEKILNHHPELKRQFQETCHEFAAYVKAEEKSSQSSVVEATRKKVLTAAERRKLIMSNPFNGPLLEAMKSRG